jgi:NADPH-dependent 2,4-dienoyl-CoA reductase/sulfur reductase-like enzyme
MSADSVFGQCERCQSLAACRRRTNSKETPRATEAFQIRLRGLWLRRLTQRGPDVTLLCRAHTVLPTVDPALGRSVQEELERHGVRVLTAVSAAEINQTATGRPSRLSVLDSAGGKHEADLVLLAVGARPDSELAEDAGVKLGAQGAVVVTRQMRTNLADVFAAGDCAETYRRLLDGPTYISLGTIAHKQGRVAGENAIGGDRIFAGALGTQSLKVFDLAIARTGLSERDARKARFDPVTVGLEANDHKAYYPGATPLRIHLTGDQRTGQSAGRPNPRQSKSRDIEADRHHRHRDISRRERRISQRSRS